MAEYTNRLHLRKVEGTEKVSEGPETINHALETLNALNMGQGDFWQAGVLYLADWSFTATINSGTGALGSSDTTGVSAWLPDPVVSGSLMRSSTTPAKLEGLAPSKLPTTTKYMTIGYELTPTTWGASATVSVVSGSEYASEAEALEHSPATTSGKMRIRDVIVKNTAGVYSIVKEHDRRPWARGYRYIVAANGEAEGGTVEITAARQRFESGGHFFRFVWSGEVRNTTAEDRALLDLIVDGSFLHGRPLITRTSLDGFVCIWEAEYAAGSHLVTPTIEREIGGKAVVENATLYVQELLGPNLNNGTS